MESNGKNDDDPVRAHTAAAVQKKIDSTLEERIRFFAAQSKEAMSRRIDELDQEWDLERVMMTGGAGAGLGGILLSLLGGGKKWLLLSGGVLGFLLMHGVQRWCQPAAALRRFGIRTRAEIDAERYALKLLRGDFESVQKQGGMSTQDVAGDLWTAVRT